MLLMTFNIIFRQFELNYRFCAISWRELSYVFPTMITSTLALQRVHCALHKEPSYDLNALLPYLFVYDNIWISFTL